MSETPELGPLAGVRVVEVGQYVAGPLATMMLADLGADVVKVEPPGKGDAFRTYGVRHEGESAFWLNVNRGKRSVTLDLRSPEDAARCRALIAEADAVLLTARPGALDAAGLDDDSLAALSPKLVRVWVTGYGATGPRSGEPVYDNLVQGLSGLASYQTGDGPDDVVAPLVIDKTSGFLVAHAMTAALYEQRATGKGRRVEVSLLDAAAYWNFPDMFQDRTFLASDRRITRLGPSVVPTKDGRIIVSPVSGRQLRSAAEAFGHPEWVEEFKAIRDHTILMGEVMRRLGSGTKDMTTADALDLLRRFDVPAAPVLDLEGHLDDPQVRHNRLYEVEHDERLGDVRVVRYPALFDGVAHRAPFRAPSPGADEAGVMEDWGLGPDVD